MQTSAIESTPEKWQNGCAGMFSLWRSWPRVAQLSGSSVNPVGKNLEQKHVFRFIIMKLHRYPRCYWWFLGMKWLGPIRYQPLTSDAAGSKWKVHPVKKNCWKITWVVWLKTSREAKCQICIEITRFLWVFFLKHLPACCYRHAWRSRSATFRNFFSNVGFSIDSQQVLQLVVKFDFVEPFFPSNMHLKGFLVNH